ncbi:MAG TPA: glycosyltransferase N-terminal domain-containing protein [Hyphomicrobiaceae bacterium]|nr:glycosyltransferase N-terminal domain-containing protein [Hyphomicrobiaceae bacterium]
METTSKKVFDPDDLTERLFGEHPAIIAFWHGQFMMVSSLNTHHVPVKAMVARHGDAELIGKAMSELGVDLIRGAGAGGRRKDRGGAQALRLAVRALNEGSSICMTADVPPGPARRVGEGIITLARLSGRPVIPVALATSRFLALDTWSRMTINLPSSILAAAGGTAIYVPRDATPEQLEVYRRQLENELKDATGRAYALAGADVTRATPAGALDGDVPPPRPGMRLKLYRLLSRGLEPIIPAWLALRTRQGKEVAGRRGERYGIASMARPKGTLVWVHAASVGETNAALPVIAALRQARDDLSFLLTTGTRTSAALAQARLGPRAIHQFVPLDSPRFAHRFVDHWKPDIAVFTESEIWPNLILEAAGHGMPLTLINARMSQRSFKRWRRNSGMAVALFSRFALVLAQNQRLARSFSLLGARNVVVSGNLKIDSPPPPVDANALQQLRTATSGRAMLLASSTHPGEDEQIAAAHKLLKATHENLLTIIVPRHPERGPAVADMLAAQGLKAARRSQGALPDATTDVYVADTIGELGTFYALAPIALIGGSLVPHGGQNPIEAARHGCAILTGPNTHNFTDSYQALLERGGARVVSDATSLAAVADELLSDAKALGRMTAGADAALEGLSGALALTVEAILGLLVKHDELQRAS